MEFFNAFGVDCPELIFQVINFLLLLYLLNRFLFKSVIRLLDERQTSGSARGWRTRRRPLATASWPVPSARRPLDEARKEAQAMIARATKIADDTQGRDPGRGQGPRPRRPPSKARERDHRREGAGDGRAPRPTSPTWRSRPPAARALRDERHHPAQAGGGLPLGDVRRPSPRGANYRWPAARPQPAATRRPPSRSAAPTARSRLGSVTSLKLRDAFAAEDVRRSSSTRPSPTRRRNGLLRRIVGDVLPEALNLVLLMVRRGRPKAIDPHGRPLPDACFAAIGGSRWPRCARRSSSRSRSASRSWIASTSSRATRSKSTRWSTSR